MNQMTPPITERNSCAFAKKHASPSGFTKTRRPLWRSLLTGLAVSAAAFSSTLSAAPVAQATFEDLNLGQINGQDGWSINADSLAKANVVAPGLDYMAADFGTISGGIQALALDNNAANRPAIRSLSPLPTDSFYVRYLISTDSLGTEAAKSELRMFFTAAPQASFIVNFFDGTINLTAIAANQVVVNPAGIEPQTTHLVVVKFNLNEAKTTVTSMQAWFNPTAADASTPHIERTGMSVALSGIAFVRASSPFSVSYIDEIVTGSDWADVVPASGPFTAGQLDFAKLNTGEINAQDRWVYTEVRTDRLPPSGVTVAEGGLTYVAPDGGTLQGSAKHLFTQAGLSEAKKMDNWLSYAPVGFAESTYVSFVTKLQTRSGGLLGNDPYELFFGLHNNAAVNSAPWNSYVALKHPAVAGNPIGVETTGSGGVLPNAKIALDKETLVVSRFEVNEEGQLTQIKVWINPRRLDVNRPDHVVTLAAPGVVLNDQTLLKFRMQNVPTRIDHLKASTSWEDVVPAAVPFTEGSVDFEDLKLGTIDGQGRWDFVETRDAPRVRAENVTVEQGGLLWTAEDGGTIFAGLKHLFLQAGTEGVGKMDNWLRFGPVSISGPAYVRFATRFETRTGTVVGATDPYELFFGLTSNAAFNSAPWNAYVALKHPLAVDGVIGVESTGSNGVLANSTLALDQVMLVVAKFDTDVDGKLTSISVWLNPNSVDEVAPDHVVTLAEPGVVLSEQTFLKFRAQNMPTRIDHIMVADTWAEVVPAEYVPPTEPEFTFDVAPIDAFVGADAVLTVSVTSGTPPYQYKWFKNGDEIPGEVGPTLNLSPLDLDDNGIYYVEITTPAGTFPSGEVSVTVTQPPPGPVVLFVETFDAEAYQTPEETTAYRGRPIAAFGWNVHHSYSGVYLPGLATGLEVEPLIFDFGTSGAIGDSEYGSPWGFAQFFIDNRPSYGQGTPESRPALPGPHPVTGEYYHNRTLAMFLWKDVVIAADERERIQSFNFIQGNRDAVYHSFFPAVRIGDNWYVYKVSNEVLAEQVRILKRLSQNGLYGEEGVFSSADFNQGYVNHYNAQPYHFAWSESGWTQLVFDGTTGVNSTVGMTLGAMLEGDLPEGNITAIGVFSPENIDPTGPSAPGYNFNGLRIDSIAILAAPPAQVDQFTFTFNNEGKVNGLDRVIQDANWDGVYSAAALPLVTSAAVLADLSEGVTNEETPGAYKAGFLFVSGRNEQPAPQAFLVSTTHLNVVNEPQLPQPFDLEATPVNPQTDWYAAPGAFTNNLGSVKFKQLQEMSIKTNPRNFETVTYYHALQLDGVWYVGTQGFKNTESWQDQVIAPRASDWYTGVVSEGSLNVDFATTAPTLVSASEMNLDALVTAIGFYIHTGDSVGTNDSWARVDSVSIKASAPAGFLPPIFVEHPAEVAVLEGETAVFTVALAESELETTFKWFFNGDEIPDETGSSLTIESVSAANVGSYYVEATNEAGTTPSNVAQLILLADPVVTPEELNVESAGGISVLTVEADSRISWSSQSNTAWISIQGMGTGVGNGSVSLQVLINSNFNARVGSVTVAGTTVIVVQAGADAFIEAYPDQTEFGAEGGMTSVGVLHTPGMVLQPTTNVDWLVVTSVESAEEGVSGISLEIKASNSLASRVGVLDIEGTEITYTQEASTLESFFGGDQNLVPGANPNEYMLEWLGPVYIVEGSDDHVWMWTVEHGWWAVFQSNVNEGFNQYWIWDHGVQDWFFVDAVVYPWIYAMNYPVDPESPLGWIYYVEGNAGNRLFYVDSLAEVRTEAQLYPSQN